MKAFNFGAVMVLLIMALSFSSASDSGTEIAGVIFNANDYTPVVGASVTVNCDGNVKTTVSGAGGNYAVIYDVEECHIESSLVVIAEKDGLSGSAAGVVSEDPLEDDWNLGIVHVGIVPEFGLVLGVLTLFASVGIFFVIRR